MKTADGEALAFVCSHVFSGERSILLVSREDGDWQFLCGHGHNADEKPHAVGLSHFISDDPALEEMKGLPSNWEAERSTVGKPWVKRKLK